jgi:site-specific recombinase XerD
MWRHTAATEMLRAGASTSQVQRILGHEHVLTTEVYVHLTLDDMVNIHEKVSPVTRLRERN